MRTPVTAALVLLVALAGAARGDDTGVEPDFDWGKAAGSKKDGYRAAMQRGDQLASRAADMVNEGDDDRGKGLALRAVDAYEAAAKIDPTQAEPHYRAAEVLNAHYIDIPHMHSIMGDTRHPAERALRHWAEFVRLAPRDPRLAGLGQYTSYGSRLNNAVLFERSLLLTKLGLDHFTAALADYDVLLPLLESSNDGEGEIATVLSNAAELRMAQGELDIAIEAYLASYELNPEPLYAYGLAVALDRDDQGERARELMTRVGYSEKPLQSNNVFFVPPGDQFYYMALGNETLGAWERAKALYEQYLRYQPKSPYAARAREHIARLGDWIKKHKKPVPKAGSYERTWP